MRHPLFGLLLALVAVGQAAWPASANAAQILDDTREFIVVRTYTPAGWDQVAGAARHVAGAILEQAGVDVGWVECRGTSGDAVAAACAQPLKWNELVVRVVPAAPAGPGMETTTLGFAAVDLGEGQGSLATVYGDRVDAMALTACVDRAELLGRAIAHELGHLLLGTNRHGSRGLMRAYWSPTDLHRSAAAQWRFVGTERDRLRLGVASRRYKKSGPPLGDGPLKTTPRG